MPLGLLAPASLRNARHLPGMVECCSSDAMVRFASMGTNEIVKSEGATSSAGVNGFELLA